MSTLEERFAARLWDAVEKTRELGYNPQRFANSLEVTDAMHLARTLVSTGELHDGFQEVVSMGHPELTLESIMLEAEFSPLFSSQHLAAARWRLDQAMAP